MERDEKEDAYLGQVIFADISTDIIKIKLKKNVEEVKLGDPVIIEGVKYDYYGIITNIQHQQKEFFKKFANTKDVKAPITLEDSGFRSDPYAPFVDVSCLNVIRRGVPGTGSPGTTIPPILSDARLANEEDIAKATTGVYKYDDTIASIGHFIGTKYDYPINLTDLFKVPFGIFGKTNFGKTVTCKDLIIRTLSSGCKVNGKPVQFIIFDAQGEYGRGIQRDKGLGLFSYLDNLHQLTIDKDSVNFAYTSGLYIDPSKLRVDDWLNAFWNYTENMSAILGKVERIRIAERKNKAKPENVDLARYFAYVYENLDKIEDEIIQKIPDSTMNALWRRFTMFNEENLRNGFLQEAPSKHLHVIEELLQLLRQGKSVIVHFGKFSQDPSIYMFVTNYIARRFWDIYSKSIDGSMPWLPHLVLLVEEAHRFVGTGGSNEYTGSNYFDKIARETRKFGLVVGLIDQRPSKINDEIISQLASRIVHRLDDEKDVSAALSGMSKFKWSPIVGKLGVGEGLFLGNVVGNLPTRIKPFWGTEKEVKKYFDLTGTAISALERQSAKEDMIGKKDKEKIESLEDDSPPVIEPEDEVERIVNETLEENNKSKNGVTKVTNEKKMPLKKVEVGSGNGKNAEKNEKIKIQKKNILPSAVNAGKIENDEDVQSIFDKDEEESGSLDRS